MPTATAKQNRNVDSDTFMKNVAEEKQTGRENPTVHRSLKYAKVKQADLILFTAQLSVMVDSGVVLSDALEAVANSRNAGKRVSQKFSAIIQDVCQRVKNGDSFSKALKTYPNVFNPMFVSMVKASEVSGSLAEMLQVLSGYLNFDAEVRKQIKSALTYPLVMAVMAVAATGTLLFFVMPRFTRIYEAKEAALPAITKALLTVSKTCGNPQNALTILTTVIVAYLAFQYWKKTPKGRRIIDRTKLQLPVIGDMFVDAVITRSMRILATMVNTGVNLLESIQVLQGATENYYFRQLWSNVDDKIRNGYQMSEAIQLSPNNHLIAQEVIQMLQAGEKSGRLGEVSNQISTFYENKLQASIKSVMTMLEPIMITILGGIIGIIAIALLLPVFKISNVITQ